jgi:hypothetical protein
MHASRVPRCISCMHGGSRIKYSASHIFIIFMSETSQESIVHRYFLQVAALRNLPVSGFMVRFANIDSRLDPPIERSMRTFAGGAPHVIPSHGPGRPRAIRVRRARAIWRRHSSGAAPNMEAHARRSRHAMVQDPRGWCGAIAVPAGHKPCIG